MRSLLDEPTKRTEARQSVPPPQDLRLKIRGGMSVQEAEGARIPGPEQYFVRDTAVSRIAHSIHCNCKKNQHNRANGMRKRISLTL